MKYLIVQQWDNTKGNHAGMEHMCDLLVEKYPNIYTKICKESPNCYRAINNDYLRKIFGKIHLYIYKRKQRFCFKKEYLSLCSKMFASLQRYDEVFLLEYNVYEAPQYDLACYIKKNFPKVKIYALSHLTPKLMLERGVDKTVLEWDKYVDKELTLGSSLSAFLKQCGIEKQKISTGFHYVDLLYYKCDRPQNSCPKQLTIIVIGALQRNFALISSIVNRLIEVHWVICRGRKETLDCLFNKTSNVELKGYLTEDELRYQMSLADISLNVMEDTVGSNVITSSMAMGLSIVVSDVGSIHDYCDESNAVFCQNSVDSFVNCIKEMVDNPEKVRKMQEASLCIAQKYKIEGIHKWFSSFSKGLYLNES